MLDFIKTLHRTTTTNNIDFLGDLKIGLSVLAFSQPREARPAVPSPALGGSLPFSGLLNPLSLA